MLRGVAHRAPEHPRELFLSSHCRLDCVQDPGEWEPRGETFVAGCLCSPAIHWRTFAYVIQKTDRRAGRKRGAPGRPDRSVRATAGGRAATALLLESCIGRSSRRLAETHSGEGWRSRDRYPKVASSAPPAVFVAYFAIRPARSSVERPRRSSAGS